MAEKTILLKVLLKQRHLQGHRAFCNEYDKVALKIEPELKGSWPSKAQFYRWLAGDLLGLPFADHCRILESMFPNWTADQLFEEYNGSLEFIPEPPAPPLAPLVPNGTAPTAASRDGQPAIDDRTADEVIALRPNHAHMPDLRILAREQVSSARRRLGLSRDEFAKLLTSILGWTPSPEVMKEWETTSVPPGEVVLAAALAAQGFPRGVLTLALNPDAQKVVDLLATIVPNLEETLGSPDIATAYAMRGLIPRPKWNDTIAGASKHLWLYGMAELGYALDDDVPSIVEEAAAKGCDIRVLLLDPDYAGIADIDGDEGSPPGTLTSRIRSALPRFQQMSAVCGSQMQIRVYNAPPTVSIVRSDDRMLVTPYLRFFVGGNSPSLELRHSAAGKMFDRYARHFQSMWDLAQDWIR